MGLIEYRTWQISEHIAITNIVSEVIKVVMIHENKAVKQDIVRCNCLKDNYLLNIKDLVTKSFSLNIKHPLQ